MPDKYLPKAKLEHGEYYAGTCRNATVARWDGEKQHFVHWRTKFVSVYREVILHPEDDLKYDVFYPIMHISAPKEIPLENVDRC